MTKWIALIRGINVGGKHLLPMASLKQHFEHLKLKNVRTYIQSGNVLFDSNTKTAATLKKKIENRIESIHGFKPRVLLLGQENFLDAIRSNPFSDIVAQPKNLHFCFLSEPSVDPDWESIRKIKTKSEKFDLVGQVFYLYTPDGIARSKLAATIEKHLGVQVTARNFRTVTVLSEMIGSDGS